MKIGFVADHLLVGQLCTNNKSDGSLLSCLKVTECPTSEIGDTPLYNTCSLPIQVMTTGPLPAPSKWHSGRFNVPRAMKTKFPATVMVFGVASSEGHIKPPHIFNTSSQHQSVPGCAEACDDPLVQSGGRWQTLGVAAGMHRPTSPKRPRLGFRRSATTLYPSLTAPPPRDLNPLDYFVWSYVENISNMTSHNTKASQITAIRRVFAVLPPALVKKLSPSSGPVSRRWWRRLHWIDVSSTT